MVLRVELWFAQLVPLPATSLTLNFLSGVKHCSSLVGHDPMELTFESGVMSNILEN